METSPGAEAESKYLRKWQETYPNITPPDLSKIIDKNGVISAVDVERSLYVCHDNIEHLLHELERERALVEFLQQLLNKGAEQKCNKNRFNRRHFYENPTIPPKMSDLQTSEISDIHQHVNIHEPTHSQCDGEGNCRDLSTNDYSTLKQNDTLPGDTPMTGKGTKNRSGDDLALATSNALCDVSVQQLLETIDGTDFFLPDDNFGHLSDDNSFDLLTPAERDVNCNSETHSTSTNKNTCVYDSSTCEQVGSTCNWECQNTVVIKNKSKDSVLQKTSTKCRKMETDSSSDDTDFCVEPLQNRLKPKRPAPAPPLPRRSPVHSSTDDTDLKAVSSNRKNGDYDTEDVRADIKHVSDILPSKRSAMDEDVCEIPDFHGDIPVRLVVSDSDNASSVVIGPGSQEASYLENSVLNSSERDSEVSNSIPQKNDNITKTEVERHSKESPCSSTDFSCRNSRHEFSKVPERPLSAIVASGNVVVDILVHDNEKHTDNPELEKTDSSTHSQPGLSSGLSIPKCPKSPTLKPKRKAPRAPAYENWSFHVAITDNKVNIIETELSDSDSDCDGNNSGSNFELSDDPNLDGPEFSDNSFGGDSQNISNSKVQLRKKSKGSLTDSQGRESPLEGKKYEIHGDKLSENDSVYYNFVPYSPSWKSDEQMVDGVTDRSPSNVSSALDVDADLYGWTWRKESTDSVGNVSPMLKRNGDGCESQTSSADEGASTGSLDEVDSHLETASVCEMAPEIRNKYKMRRLYVNGILESEKVYLSVLELLLKYKHLLHVSSTLSKPVVSPEDVTTLFYKVDHLLKIHQEFLQELEPIVKNWSHDQKIANVFKLLVVHFPVYGEYMQNYPEAIETLRRCSQENPKFQEITSGIIMSHEEDGPSWSKGKEITKLEDMLLKPVVRVQSYALLLHDLINYTPLDHPDAEELQKALKLSQHNVESFQVGPQATHSTKPEENRHLAKSGFVVELVGDERKLRYIFLFSDVIVCTKHKMGSKNRAQFECKWFLPISHLKADIKSEEKDVEEKAKTDIDAIKKKISILKSDLRHEMKKEKSRKEKAFSLVGRVAARNVEKLKKKLQELEAAMLLASPTLPLYIEFTSGKVHTLLMSTDYEREEWREALTAQINRSKTGVGQKHFDAYEIQELINSSKQLPQVNSIGSVLLKKDEDVLTGTLNVTIHRLIGLNGGACDTYCCVEMDSFGHFFMKAKTHVYPHSSDPAWNEDFELDLDGSETLRILCYKKEDGSSGDVLLGRSALELNKSWLNNSFKEKTISMNEISLIISVRHTPVNKTMKRSPSGHRSAVFGVKISTCARREGKTIPSIVTLCIQEVEKRGFDQVGLYRISGVSSEIQKLKKAFDKHNKNCNSFISDCDINAVTGVLKLYFRELPEPLFTEAFYQRFIDTLSLTEPDAKESCMLSLLHSLPDANYYTIVYLIEHLIRVNSNALENKMSLTNLATIFGPTLMQPAVKASNLSAPDMFLRGAQEVVQQSGVLSYFLSLASGGKNLRRSA